MKKYTIETYKEFCENALDVPPIEEFAEGIINECEWYATNQVRIIKGNHEIVLDYTADVANELDYMLGEIYELECGSGTSTTGNAVVTNKYRDATWEDILRLAVLNEMYESKYTLKEAVKGCIRHFTPDKLRSIMQELSDHTSIADELEVNFDKIDITGFWRIFDEFCRRQAFYHILCQNIEITELIDADGRYSDIVVIMDYSIKPSGDLVGWHYGVDFDPKSEVNCRYINDYIKEVVGDE